MFLDPFFPLFSITRSTYTDSRKSRAVVIMAFSMFSRLLFVFCFLVAHTSMGKKPKRGRPLSEDMMNREFYNKAPSIMGAWFDVGHLEAKGIPDARVIGLGLGGNTLAIRGRLFLELFQWRNGLRFMKIVVRRDIVRRTIACISHRTFEFV